MSNSLRPHGLNMPRFPVHHQLPDLAQTHVHRVSDAIQPSHPLLSPSPLAFNLLQHRGLFQWVKSSHQVAKVLKFQLEQQSFQWIFQVISFMIDWLDLLAVQGTLKSLLQHHSSKVSILQHSTFFFFGAHSYSHVPIPDYLVSNLSSFLFPSSRYIFCFTRISYIFELVHQGHFSKLFLLGEQEHFTFFEITPESTVHFWCIHICIHLMFTENLLCVPIALPGFGNQRGKKNNLLSSESRKSQEKIHHNWD